MKICLIGNNLTTLLLANILSKKSLAVDIFSLNSIKHNYSYEIHYNNNYIGGIEGYIEDNILYIKYLFIFEEYRRMKLGSKLIQIIESHAKFFKCNYIFLTLHEDEYTEFYKKQGFMILFEINNCPNNFIKIFLQKKIN